VRPKSANDLNHPTPMLRRVLDTTIRDLEVNAGGDSQNCRSSLGLLKPKLRRSAGPEFSAREVEYPDAVPLIY